jgi:hypothetical protein
MKDEAIRIVIVREDEAIQILREFVEEAENQAMDYPPPRDYPDCGWEQDWPRLLDIYRRAKKLLVQIDEREERESDEDESEYE